MFLVYICVYMYIQLKKFEYPEIIQQLVVWHQRKLVKNKMAKKKQNELYRKNCNSFLYIFFVYLLCFFCVEKKFCVLERNEKKFCIVF